jgi:hypothetical protein
MTRKAKIKPDESKTTNPKLTAYERTRARQTGASIEQLRAEQRAAERMMKLKEAAKSIGDTD